MGFERVTHVLRVLIAASVTSSGQSASGRELALNLDIHNERRLLNHSSALMKVFVDRDCLLHDPPYEILSGKPVPYFESPARWHAIKHELESSPSFEIAECDSDIDVLGYAQAIHDRDYIQYLRNAYEDWVADGNDKTAVLPETFQHPKLLSPLPSIDDSAEALSPIAKAGASRFQCHVSVSTPLAQGSIASTLAVPSRKKPTQQSWLLCKSRFPPRSI